MIRCQRHPDSFALPSRHPVVIGGTACGVALQLHPRPLPPHSILSMTEEQPRCHSGPQRWPLPCRLWCPCPPPGPGCTLLSSPGRRSSQGGTRGAAGSAGRRRWRWGQSGVLQCHYLEEKNGNCFGVTSKLEVNGRQSNKNVLGLSLHSKK